MFGLGSAYRSRDLFAWQFTPREGGFWYRKNGTGAAFAVTAAERDALVAVFAGMLALRGWDERDVLGEWRFV